MDIKINLSAIAKDSDIVSIENKEQVTETLMSSCDDSVDEELIMSHEIIGAESTCQSELTSSFLQKKEVNMPDIGIDEVEVTEILVKIGEKVTVEQSLITVEGNKAVMEIPSPCTGTVREISVNIGDTVRTGSKIMIFELEEDVVSISSSKTIDMTSDTAGTEGSSSQSNLHKSVNDVLSSSNGVDQIIEKYPYIHASPVVRRLAREFGINLEKIKGSGRKGRILYEDVQFYIKKAVQNTDANLRTINFDSVASSLLPWPKIDFSKFGDTKEEELNRIQKISGANLHRNWMMIPHVTQFDEVDVTEIEIFRKKQNEEAAKKKENIKITLLVFIMKAVAKALEEFPRFNSSLLADTQKLILKKYINIGVAVDTPNGLLVPVFRNIKKKGILELSYELTEISKKARSGKLNLSDMESGCFTISNLGGIGGIAFTPIVNAPEVATLGVSKLSMKGIWNGKDFSPKLILPLSLSYDHRVIDGADGARFINLINEIMSDFRRLVM
ncbi:dihydrolipoyllysine-residue acetyltransferase [Sodalis sp. CWE]|nr:dihydrolipoyllysine-residue acetyltransferase [Sodalis sp. CWE]MBX4180697.1 dihydrolipoyllysine-residue acetyltransferase [Sodalis sp. CWE]